MSSELEGIAEVVFIHLGTRIPRYLHLNLSRTRKILGPEATITLVSDQKAGARIAKKAGVTFYEYKRISQSWPEPQRDMGFRSGYWLHTIERFDAFAEYHIQGDRQRPALMVESDVIIFKGFPWAELNKFSRLAWASAGEGQDVGALVYSPNSHATSSLISRMRELCEENPKLSDMEALYLARQGQLAGKAWLELPVWRQEFSRLKSWNHDPNSGQNEYFEGIFDGSLLGTWATGGDPKSYWGLERRFYLTKQNRYLDLPNTTLRYKTSEFFAVNNGKHAKLYNLHVHSKNSRFFKGDREIAKLAKQSEKKTVIRNFRFVPLVEFLSTWVGIYVRGVRRLFLH
jgi:hypothetical protein